MTTFADELRRLKRDRNLSHSELAFLADCDQSYISRILTGQRSPSPEMIDRIGVAVGMTDQDILHWIIVTAIPERFQPTLLQRERVVRLDDLMTGPAQMGEAA